MRVGIATDHGGFGLKEELLGLLRVGCGRGSGESMPSWDIFEHQTQEYQDKVLPPEVTRRVAVEGRLSDGSDTSADRAA
jgi:hypothetical protein